MTTTLPSQMAALLARAQDQAPERMSVEEHSRSGNLGSATS